ncbi:tgrB1 [Acrasis kona]|uniref:TgrB1 n=1 Tax=Acrasis kona TaxID=1008807 RepID=A0AAW2Z579_9EUKA
MTTYDREDELMDESRSSSLSPENSPKNRRRSHSTVRAAPYPVPPHFSQSPRNDMETESDDDIAPITTLPSISETIPQSVLQLQDNRNSPIFAPIQNPNFAPPSYSISVAPNTAIEQTTQDSNEESPNKNADVSAALRRHSTPTRKLERVNSSARSSSVGSSNNGFIPSVSTLLDSPLDIDEGFKQTPKLKVTGGKDNKDPLPVQTIAVNVNYFIDCLKLTAEQFSALIVRASLAGYKKPSPGKDIVVLGILEEQKMPSVLNYSNKQRFVVRVSFRNLIVKHSSHNNGQKLLLRFSVIDPKEGNELKSIDSAEFETITRRGIEKQKQKDYLTKRHSEGEVSSSILLPAGAAPPQPHLQTLPTPPQNRQFSFHHATIHNKLPTEAQLIDLNIQSGITSLMQAVTTKPKKIKLNKSAQVISITPDYADTTGRVPCKINVKGFPEFIPLDSLRVYFGDLLSDEMFFFKEEVIVCTIPHSKGYFGEVPIRVMVDGEFVQNSVRFTYRLKSLPLPQTPPPSTTQQQSIPPISQISIPAYLSGPPPQHISHAPHTPPAMSPSLTHHHLHPPPPMYHHVYSQPPHLAHPYAQQQNNIRAHQQQMQQQQHDVNRSVLDVLFRGPN